MSSPIDLWFAALHMRVEQLRVTFPQDLLGVIQFEIAGKDALRRFVLRLSGPKTSLEDGVASEVHALVRSTEAEIETLLGDDEAPPALRVWGNAALLRRFFKHLVSWTSAQSIIGIRSAR